MTTSARVIVLPQVNGPLQIVDLEIPDHFKWPSGNLPVVSAIVNCINHGNNQLFLGMNLPG